MYAPALIAAKAPERNELAALMADELRRLLHYDRETGVFTWRSSGTGRRRNLVAGNPQPRGYLQITVHGVAYYAHRLAWMYEYGAFPSEAIDHINGIRGDNRIVNLRAVSDQENMRNQTRPINNTSGVIGVRWVAKKRAWRAQIAIGKRNVSLGSFASMDAAIDARKSAEEAYGFHPNHGREKMSSSERAAK